MNAHELLNLLNELGEKIIYEALPSILSISSKEFNKFNNTGDSIYHMTLKSNLIHDFASKRQDFAIRKATFLWTSTHNVTR